MKAEYKRFHLGKKYGCPPPPDLCSVTGDTKLEFKLSIIMNLLKNRTKSKSSKKVNISKYILLESFFLIYYFQYSSLQSEKCKKPDDKVQNRDPFKEEEIPLGSSGVSNGHQNIITPFLPMGILLPVVPIVGLGPTSYALVKYLSSML